MRPFLLVLLLLGGWSGRVWSAAPPSADAGGLRLGFNFAMFVGVNENDARASVRALSASIAHDNGIRAVSEPQIFDGSDAIARAIDAAEVDAIGLTTPEFKQLAEGQRFDRFLFSVRGDDPNDVYVLLVSRSAHLTRLDELQGKSLVMVDGPRLSLALPWIEVTLAAAGLPEGNSFFRQVAHQIKPSKAILDTYFRKTDACLTTRAAFDAMAELNPQIGTQLEVLASSPPIIPSLFAFRAGFDAATKARVIDVFTTIHRTLSGQQALTIFQVTRVVERPRGVLDPSFALLDAFAQARPKLATAYTQRVRQGLAPFAKESP